MNFPVGCRIIFNVPNPAASALAIDDVFEARRGELLQYNLYHIYDAADCLIRTVNYSHVLIISPLTTVGPANAHHRPDSA